MRFNGLIALIIVLVLVFEVWMFIDAFKNPRLSSSKKFWWCLGMFFIHPFIAIAYYFMVFKKVY